MNNLFKQRSIQDLVRYNKYLLIIAFLLAISNLIAIISVVLREESWVLIPAIEPDRRMIISSKNYNETYLKEWASFVIKELLTTSPEDVERQIAELKVISRKTTSLNKFYEEHLEFVKGSNVTSFFKIKNMKILKEGVLVQGTFRYWFGESGHNAIEKIYLLTFKRGLKQLLLLTNVEEKKEWIN